MRLNKNTHIAATATTINDNRITHVEYNDNKSTFKQNEKCKNHLERHAMESSIKDELLKKEKNINIY